MAERLTDIREGMVLGGEYEIVATGSDRLEIGAGAMGAVYLAKDRTLGRRVVIKTIRTANLKSQDDRVEYLERFQKEAVAAGMCNHPNLVTLYRAVFDDPAAPGVAWYAMEYIPDAVDVADRLEQSMSPDGKSTVPFPEIEQFLTDAALGLREVHGHNIVHRDIKLDNYLVYPTADGPRHKLLDFGVARYPESNLTMTGEILGTPAYMSPERARSFLGARRHEATFSDDLFAVGVASFLLITGERPWKGTRDFGELMRRLTEDPPPDITALRPETPQGLAHVTLRLLEKFAEDRYPTAQALLDDVRRIDSLGPYTQVPIPPGGARARHNTATQRLGPLADKSINADINGFLDQQPNPGEPPPAEAQGSPAALPPVGVVAPAKTAPPIAAPSPAGAAPELDGDAANYAALPDAPPVKKPFWALPSRTRLALVGGGAVLAGVLLVLLFSLSKRATEIPSASAAVLDPDAMNATPQAVTADEMVALERRSQQEKLLDADRERRARAAAANPPLTPDVGGETPSEVHSKQTKPRSRARTAASPTAAPTSAPTAAPAPGSATAASGSPVPPVAPDGTPRRHKNPEDMVAASPTPPGGAKPPASPGTPPLGIAIDTKIEVRLNSAVSSEAPETLVVAVLDKPFALPAMKAPLVAGTKLFGRAEFHTDTGRVGISFSKLQLPSGAVYAVQAQAVDARGQAGLAAVVVKKDQRNKANVGEAVVDAVETVIGDAPGSNAAGRWTNDKRDDARTLRESSSTLSLPIKKRFLIQFLQAV